MIRTILLLSVLFVDISSAKTSLKEAFLEGIKATLNVIEYEKAQASNPVFSGFCTAISSASHKVSLTISEEVKLESLALYFHLSPAMLASDRDDVPHKHILCLDTGSEMLELESSVRNIEKSYPRLKEYHIEIKMIPENYYYHVVPGIGRYGKAQQKEKKETPFIVETVQDSVDKDIYTRDTPVEATTEDILLEKSSLNKVYFISKAKSHREKVVFSSQNINIYDGGINRIYFIYKTVRGIKNDHLD